MLPAGAYSQLARFERRPSGAADPYGNTLGAWSEAESLGERSAAFRPDVLKEQMEAGRLVAPLIGVLTVRSDAVTRSATAADRVVLLRAPYAGRQMEILSIMPTTDGAEIEFALQERRD